MLSATCVTPSGVGNALSGDSYSPLAYGDVPMIWTYSVIVAWLTGVSLIVAALLMTTAGA